jgi:hypothetical protein
MIEGENKVQVAKYLIYSVTYLRNQGYLIRKSVTAHIEAAFAGRGRRICGMLSKVSQR